MLRLVRHRSTRPSPGAARSQRVKHQLGVAVPYAIANVFLTVLAPIIVSLTFVG